MAIMECCRRLCKKRIDRQYSSLIIKITVMKKFSFLVYLFVLAIITIIFGVIYVAVQQSYRSGANDPQIQIVRDINFKLREGKAVESFFTDSFNIAQSLSPF